MIVYMHTRDALVFGIESIQAILGNNVTIRLRMRHLASGWFVNCDARLA
jgi:hypothetical protein